MKKNKKSYLSVLSNHLTAINALLPRWFGVQTHVFIHESSDIGITRNHRPAWI